MNERHLVLIHPPAKLPVYSLAAPMSGVRLASGVFLMLAALANLGCTTRLEPREDQHHLPTAATEFGEMILVPAGEFAMGSNRGEDDERPVHNVWVDSFWIDKCEVTQNRFSRLTGKDSAHFKGAENPVERVPWGDAAWYCNHRSRAEGLQPCYDEETGVCDFAPTATGSPRKRNGSTLAARASRANTKWAMISASLRITPGTEITRGSGLIPWAERNPTPGASMICTAT